MPRSRLCRLASILMVTASVCGLGACGVPPAYLAEQLRAVPVPASALMQKAPPPECEAPPDQEAAEVKAEPDASETETDSEADESDTRTSEIANETEQSPEPPAEADAGQIEQERDCYKRAEQVARVRLDKLQASAADTVAALGKISSQLQPGGHSPN